jgi:hypothetical protein
MSDSTEPDGDPIVRKQLEQAEKLLAEIRDGKHSIQGLLVQIERYFAERGESPRVGS